ncbi:uncharacterized protein TrAFT101_007566 [Trichoderma asperellum]|uniref:uncharacterized protein n=1 Tax=Trichoderma asperellum TaxID=101201 RepID=UPI003327DF76|nr:hypothetical protein TrAFT101_007566 [Trichoderma asperellum]
MKDRGLVYESRSNRSAITIRKSDCSPLSLLLQVGLDESFPSILGAVYSPVENNVPSGVRRRREQNVCGFTLNKRSEASLGGNRSALSEKAFD